MKKNYFGLVFCFCSFCCFSQTEKKISVRFCPKFASTKLFLVDSTYKINKQDTLKIEVLKFYISKIELLENSKTVWKEENSFHLLDASIEKSLTIFLNIQSQISFNQIQFKLGIDSLTNVSGALGGDLDPTKGMYWTWQSGYINFKLEGISNVCKTRNNAFQFHLGGYQSPFNALQTIKLAIDKSKNIEIDLDIRDFISEIDLSTQNHIMSPAKQAVLLSQKLSQLFRLRQ